MPDLVSYALVSVGDTKTFLGISTSEYDSLITMLINQATDYIESKTGRRFKRDTYTDELVDGDGNTSIQIKNYPIASITSISENDDLNNEESWSVISSTDYFNRGGDFEAGIIHRTATFRRGHANYKVTYVGGYETIPYDLQYAAMMLVGETFNRRRSAGVKSESLGDHSVTFESIAQSTDRVMEILNNYRRMIVL